MTEATREATPPEAVADVTMERVRHPEKAHRPDNPVQKRKPAWIRVKAPTSATYQETRRIMREHNLHTVCEEAACPNIGECWSKKHATMMILGSVCTRACSFCNVVVTSVDRDDLPDGGAGHFAETILRIRKASPGTTIEVLTPDFLRKKDALAMVVGARPDVFNHNLEAVPRLYGEVRPGARYFASLRLLQQARIELRIIPRDEDLLAGLGEGREEVLQLMDDLRSAEVDFMTIGQYLQPTPKHHVVDRFVEPDEFAAYARFAYAKGFLMVSSSPLTRSSYFAGDDFRRLREARDRRLRGETVSEADAVAVPAAG